MMLPKTKYPNKGWVKIREKAFKKGAFVLTDDVTKHNAETMPGPKPLDSEIDYYVFGIDPIIRRYTEEYY